jgi:hypothetical protein
MGQKSVNQKPSSERIVKDIRRATASNIRPRRRSVSCWTAFEVSTAVPRLRWRVATRSYRRIAGDHRKAARPLRRYLRRASGRLCSTELHYHWGHDRCFPPQLWDRRTYGSEDSCSATQKDFFDSIGPTSDVAYGRAGRSLMFGDGLPLAKC